MDVLSDPVPQPTVAGLQAYPLRQLHDARGAVLHMLRCDAPHFAGFGEVYFSLVHHGSIKAWKRHRRMAQNIAVPIGRIGLVVFDDRDQSASRGARDRLVVGRPGHYCLIHIPPMVWYGFTGLSAEPALIANCADLPHDPAETETRPVDEDAFAWCRTLPDTI